VSGLLLARGLQRLQEYAVRGALGAQRSRLFRQALSESLVLALSGGLLGAVLAMGAVKLLKAIGRSAIPRLDAVTISWPVLVCCLVAAVLAAVLAGFVPALRASRLDPAQAMKDSGRTGSASRAERRLLSGVAVLQSALTLALLMAAGLLIRTVDNLARVRPGFGTQNILTMNVTLPDWDGQKMYDFHVQSLERLSSLPGVRKAAFGWGLPLTGDKWINFVTIEGQPGTDKLADTLTVAKRSVTPDYFDALGIPIVAGRGFRPSDNLENWKSRPEPAPGETPYVCIINQAMAERCFPNSNAVGRTMRVPPWRKRPCEIIGVVANTRTEALSQNPEPEIYSPFLQGPVFNKHLIVRTASDPKSLIHAVQRELRGVDPTVAIEHIKTFDQIRAESVAAQTFAMRLLVGFALAGSVLALVGIYSVLSLSVGSRRRELAIRIAVGAQCRQVLRLIFRQGLNLIAAGLILGTAATCALARVLRALLFGVEPTDAITFVAVATLFTAVALLACFVPARAATKVDPMEVLRYE
jgi:putative ABC transport system permease protein